jgi:hypothetical protein
VQVFSDDLQETSAVVAAGGDPTYLESALAEGGARVGTSCAMAGWTEWTRQHRDEEKPQVDSLSGS